MVINWDSLRLILQILCVREREYTKYFMTIHDIKLLVFFSFIHIMDDLTRFLLFFLSLSLEKINKKMKMFKSVGLQHHTELIQYSDLVGKFVGFWTFNEDTVLFNGQPVSEMGLIMYCNSMVSIKNHHVQPLLRSHLNKFLLFWHNQNVIPAEKISGEDYSGCLQVYYQNGYKKLPTNKLVFNREIAVVSSSPLIPSKKTRSHVVWPWIWFYVGKNWPDFKYCGRFAKIFKRSKTSDGWQNVKVVNVQMSPLLWAKKGKLKSWQMTMMIMMWNWKKFQSRKDRKR